MLPPELWHNVLHYADPLQTRCICRQWYHLSHDSLVDTYRKYIVKSFQSNLLYLEWIYRLFQLTREEATTQDNLAFRWTSQGGHLPVLQWLHATYQITREEATTWDNSVFRWASKGCHLHVLQWLHDTYGITE